MSVQPVSPEPSTLVGSSPSDTRTPVPAGVTVVLAGALLLAIMRSFPIADVGPRSPWDSWIVVVLPTLALPAALLWWTLSPVAAQRLLPLILGVALVPAVVLTLVPAIVGSVPEVVLGVLGLLSSAAIWSVTAIVLICAATLASSGRAAAARCGAAVVILAGLLAPITAFSIRTLAPELPSQVYPLLLLVVAIAFVVGGSIAPRSDVVPHVVPVRTAVATVIGGLVSAGTYWATYFVLTSSSEGPRSTFGWFGGLGVVLAVVAIAGATLLGREALVLVLGAGLLLGCLYGLTSSVGSGLGRDWWPPLLVLVALVGAAAVATARRAREIGLCSIAVLGLVLLATYLVVVFGHLDESIEIGLTLVGLVAGALAGGSTIGAVVPRLLRTVDLVPVLLLTLALGGGVTRVLTWAAEVTDIERNTSLLWICGVLVLAAAAVLGWPRSAGASSTGTAGTGVGPGVTPAGDQLHGSARPVPPAW